MLISARRSSSPGALTIPLHPKQWLAFETPATEVLYGGAAGGGKSHLMRIAAVTWCTEIKGLQVYLFRRISDDLARNHMDGPKGFRALLAPWVAMGWCQIIEDEIRFWNGSKIHLCHCKDEKHVFKYQGAEIHVLIIDELTHFTEFMYRYLRNRVRMVGMTVPKIYEGRFPRILCGANPGNIGHLWVKKTFIEGCPPYKIRLVPREEGGMTRQYIRATLEDNPSMAADDPGYEYRLEGLGSKTLVAAMRWGDWNVIEGAFFDCWEERLHVVTPFAVPRDWLRFRSGDWGSATPFSIGWWAVVQDDHSIDAGDFAATLTARGGAGRNQSEALGNARLRTLPRGCLVRYREWYGKGAADNVGLKLTAEQVGDGIAERESLDPKIAYGVLDPSAFKVDSGPSIAERLNGKLIKKGRAAFHEADNKRVAQAQGTTKRGPMSGWDQLRARMVGEIDPDGGKPLGRPMVVCFSTCTDSIRTIPVLQHDTHRPEDLNTNSEDHAADDWRYACMSRPYRKTPLAPEAPKDGYSTPSTEIPHGNFKVM